MDNIDTRALIIFAVIGIIAGFIASLLLGGGGGILRYLLTGVIGAFAADEAVLDPGARPRLGCARRDREDRPRPWPAYRVRGGGLPQHR